VELTAFRIVTLEEASHQARGLATFTPPVWKEIGSTPKGHLAKNVVLLTTVVWNMTPCGLVDRYHLFGGISRLRLQNGIIGETDSAAFGGVS